MGEGNCGDPEGRLETLQDPTCDREGSGYSRVSRESWGIKRVGQVSQLRILITQNTQPMVKWVRPGPHVCQMILNPRTSVLATRGKGFFFSLCLLKEDLTVKSRLGLNLKHFCPRSLTAGHALLCPACFSFCFATLPRLVSTHN